MKECSVSGCARIHSGKGLCSLHLARLRHKGTMDAPIVGLPLGEKLRAKRVVTPSDCWEWQGFRNRAGYGQIGINYKVKLVHRVAYELWVGEIPAGRIIMHTCDHPPCFNPEHLVCGTNADNRRDMLEKGRGSKGSKFPGSKLNEEKVRHIKTLLKSVPQCKIADMFGVDAATINYISRGKTWKSV